MSISVSDSGSIILVLLLALFLNEKKKNDKLLTKMKILKINSRKALELFQIPHKKRDFNWCLSALDLINDFICQFQSYGVGSWCKEYIEKDVKQKQFSFSARLKSYSSSPADELDKLHLEIAVTLQELSDRSIRL